ncbi:MAG TPA: large conductance mechanosensitive channel protein MscL [Pantanalinema sp.]
MSIVKEFREFVARGNVLDLAIAVVIGMAFGRVITSFVDDVLMPPIGMLFGKTDFSNLFVTLNGTSYPSLEAARAAGAPAIAYGAFINTLIQFLIVAASIFAVIRTYNRLAGRGAATQHCPFCDTDISTKASRCPNCTSALKPGVTTTWLPEAREAPEKAPRG